jgi:hypothetical protein
LYFCFAMLAATCRKNHAPILPEGVGQWLSYLKYFEIIFTPDFAAATSRLLVTTIWQMVITGR